MSSPLRWSASQALASLHRAAQITRFGGPEVLDVVDVPDPEAGPGQMVYGVSTAGVNYADTHHGHSARKTVA